MPAVLALVAGLTIGSLRDGRQDVAAPSASATATATATHAAAATAEELTPSADRATSHAGWRPGTNQVWDPETGAQSSIGFGLSLGGRELYVVELPSGRTERIRGATGIPIGGVRLR